MKRNIYIGKSIYNHNYIINRYGGSNMEKKNKVLGIIICMLMMVSVIPISGLADQTTNNSTTTNDLQQPSGTESTPITTNTLQYSAPASEHLSRGNYPVPEYNFSKLPTTLVHSWYDYQISNYNGQAIQRQTNNGNGEYAIFHIRPTSATLRKICYAYINNTLGIQSFGQIAPSDTLSQGFPGVAIHPASGDPIVSWHEDTDADTRLETEMTYDNFAGTGTPNHWVTPGIFEDNDPDVYVWPYMYVGPSPYDGYVRVYQITENNVNLPGSIPDENIRLEYTDVINTANADLSALTSSASWTMVRVLDSFRDAFVRPFDTFAIDYNHPGKVAFIGDAAYMTGVTNPPVDEGAFVWESYDYGQTWLPSDLHSDGPGAQIYNVNNPGFTEAPAVLNVTICGWHNTAFYDSEGNLHWTFMQQYGYSDDAGSYYFPSFLPQAEMIWDGTAFTFREVPELPGHDDLSGHSVPWIGNVTYPVVTFSNYPGASPVFSENTEKQAYNTENNWIAQVWVDGTKEYLGDTLADPNYADYIHHPVIEISVSPDNGRTWSDPIELTDIYSPLFSFANQITVYPFICDKIVDLGNNWGRLDMIYMNDSAWGSYVQSQGANTGGDINFCSVKIHFPEVGAFIAEAGGPYAALVGENIQFTGSATGGTGPYTWHWAFGDSETADVQNPTHAYQTAGTYTATLTVTDTLSAHAIDNATVIITIPQIPGIEIGTLKGGLLQVSAEIKSVGNVDANNVVWTITIKGGLLGLINVSANGTIASLAPGTSENGIAKSIFGLGKITINVTAVADDVTPVKKNANAIVLGPFILGLKEV
jgi:PKD repeat protein